jgi:hypothetical protein
MTQKNRLLYPLVACAVISVATFSCLGVAAITGHLPVGKGALDPYFGLSADNNHSAVAAHTRLVETTHSGLTRHRGADPVPPSRPFGLRPGQRITQAQADCPTCGVIHSIEPGAAGATAAAATVAKGHTQTAALVFGAIHSDNGAAALGVAQAPSFVVRVKMEDGTVRTIYEVQRPRFSVGERVRLINGSIVSQG